MTVPAEIRPGAPLLIVGQAPSAIEAEHGRPFIGSATGKELWRWAAKAGFEREQVSITNVWDRLVPGLPIMTASTTIARKDGFWHPDMQVAANRWLRPEWWDGPERLKAEVAQAAPTCILALGNEALWALSGLCGIEARRGSMFRAHGIKAIATFHPAAIIRGGWVNRPFAIGDTTKAWREAQSPTWPVPLRTLWLEPSLDDIRTFEAEYLNDADIIGVDIETARGEITSIAFAPSPYISICIPFSVAGRTYWPSAADEIEAWAIVKRICENPRPKVLQNGLYDAQWLWVIRGIALRNYCHDTRLSHHALWPEWPKSLGFMGSLHETETWWKMWGVRGTTKTDKGDD